MSMRRFAGSLACVVAVLALVVACGGTSTKETTAETAPPAAPPTTPSEAAAPVANAATQTPAAADAADYDPATATGAVKGIPAPTNSAPIEAVANFYTELPGFDMTVLTARQRERLLHRVNSELCTCGCKHETLGFCLVNDPKCPNVKGLVQAVYDEVKSGK